MTLRLSNYDASPTIAIVDNSTMDLAGKAKCADAISVGDDSIILKKANKEYSIDRNVCSPCDYFHDGDIVKIAENGIVYKLYDASSDDATIFVTGECNSNCIMCPCSDWERKTNTGMPDDWLIDFITLLPTGLRDIVVTGGEPTLKTDQFFLVLKMIAEKYPFAEVLLLTNGRSFSAKSMIERLNECCPQHLLAAIPLHGEIDIMHDSITRSPGSFRQTLAGIQNLLDAGIDIEIRIVVSKLNCTHLSEIAQLICDQLPKVRIVNFVGLETLGNCAKNFKSVYIEQADASKYIKPAVEILANAGIDVSLYNYVLCAVDRGLWTLCKKSISPYKVRFPDECETCTLKNCCGGFFGSTLSVAKPQVEPIHL